MFKFLISTNLNEPLSSLPCGVIQSAETEPVSETSSDGLLRIQSRSAVGLMRNKTSKLALKPEVAWNRVDTGPRLVVGAGVVDESVVRNNLTCFKVERDFVLYEKNTMA